MTSSILSPHAPQTVSISFVHGLLSGMSERGLPFEHLLESAGIADELLQHPGARVTAAQYLKLFRDTCTHLDDECLALLSRPFKLGSYSLMAQSALYAPDVQQAITRIVHTFVVLQDDMTLALVTNRELKLAGVELRFIDERSFRRQFMHVHMLRALWRLLDWLVGGDFPVVRFDFAFAPPADAVGFSDFFGSPISYDKPVSAFWFDDRLLQSPVRVDETGLRDFLSDPQVKLRVPGADVDEISAKVRSHLHATKPAWPDLDATAIELFMSPASLQRKLAREGVTFQALKDELRRDLAVTYLKTTTMSLKEIADKLGFSESSAFQRAFKGWTGSAPGSYRR